MTAFSQNYGNLTVGDLAFQAIHLDETNTVTGSATIAVPFASSAGPVEPFSQAPPVEIGFGWGA